MTPGVVCRGARLQTWLRGTSQGASHSVLEDGQRRVHVRSNSTRRRTVMAAWQTLLGVATFDGSRPTTGCMLRSQPDKQYGHYVDYPLTSRRTAALSGWLDHRGIGSLALCASPAVDSVSPAH